MGCSWTYEHYAFCIRKARSLGYVFARFMDIRDYDAAQRLIILRHDIDLSISRALALARLERELGVTATYFVRVHAPTYNIFEYRTYRALREILGLGHEIGLHFEAMDFSHITGQDPREVFMREKRVLETVLGISVVSAAAHGEHAPAGPRHNRDFFNCVPKEAVDISYDAYEPLFTRDMKYLSDSAYRWREGCMCNHIGKHPRMHILTHPVWWFREHPYE